MKKKIIIMIACIFVMLSLIVGYYLSPERKYAKGKFASKVKIEDIVGMGVGTKTAQDTYLVLDANLSAKSINYINVIPGKYMTYLVKSGKYVYLRKESHNKHLTYDEAKILCYDLKTKQLDKTIDIMKWINQWNDVQYSGLYYFESGGSEHIYVELNFYGKQKLGNGYEEKSGLTVYVDSETEDFKVIKGRSFVKDFDPLTEEQIELYSQMKEGLSNKEYWEDYRKKNNFAEYSIGEYYPSGQEMKEEIERYFAVESFSTINGVATVELSTASLPEKNKALYERFPELEQYRDQEWRMVRIYLGGYPTKEEIASLFVEENIEGQ
jgi:hypothetical protein